tara:strand:+ start:102 stop:443 length:342 start_codon:yes stop_codon:yes gene_type:complete
MLNIKTIILLVGVFLMTIGFVNNQKPTVNEKQVFKPFPRNVYDEIWLSQPSLLYDQDMNHKMNPTYILEDASDYKSLFQKTPYLNQTTSDYYSDVNKRIEYYEETSNYSFKDK